MDLSPAVPAKRARYSSQHVRSVWADQLELFFGHGLPMLMMQTARRAAGALLLGLPFVAAPLPAPLPA
jgi:hypothetical protein